MSKDPQIIARARLKEGEKADLIIFDIPLGPIKLTCIVNVPAEGEEESLVYIKFKFQCKS